MAVAAFLETQLDNEIAYGAAGGPMFKTTILQLSSGYEYRNVEWSQVRGQWDVAYGIRTQAQMDGVRALFMSCMGRATGFRFKDWADYEVPAQQIGSTNGTQTTFQIYKTYAAASGSFTRVINKPVSGSETVRVNGVQITAGAGAGQYQIDYTTGIITLGATLAGTSGHTVVVACQYDVPVRFDSDHFAPKLIDYNVQSWEGIVLVEIRL